jgi:hypothetical protein
MRPRPRRRSVTIVTTSRSSSALVSMLEGTDFGHATLLYTFPFRLVTSILCTYRRPYEICSSRIPANARKLVVGEFGIQLSPPAKHSSSHGGLAVVGTSHTRANCKEIAGTMTGLVPGRLSPQPLAGSKADRRKPCPTMGVAPNKVLYLSIAKSSQS